MGDKNSKKVVRSSGNRKATVAKAGARSKHGKGKKSFSLDTRDAAEQAAIKADRDFRKDQRAAVRAAMEAAFLKQSIGYAKRGSRLTKAEESILAKGAPEVLRLAKAKAESRNAGAKMASIREGYRQMAKEISNDKQFDAEVEEMEYAEWAKKASEEWA